MALLGLVSACGGATPETAPPTSAPSALTAPADAPSRRSLRAAPKPTRAKPAKVLVTVVDGDTHRRVRGARVVIGHRADYADKTGLAKVKIKRRAALPVRVS